MPPERIEQLRRWHDAASAELHRSGPHDVEYLGLALHVPSDVFPPTPTSDLLGSEVMTHSGPGLRVLDMGCGAGANAILAAREGAEVVAVDINPAAVTATADNARRNGVADRVRSRVSDVFDAVEGTFDLIVIDPPFRWFAPRDMLERAFADEDYRMLGRFIGQVAERLRSSGAALVFFGTSGDVEHLADLIDRAGLQCVRIAERTLHVRGEDAVYFVLRLTNEEPPIAQAMRSSC